MLKSIDRSAGKWKSSPPSATAAISTPHQLRTARTRSDPERTYLGTRRNNTRCWSHCDICDNDNVR
jgi:hypothetical protein